LSSYKVVGEGIGLEWMLDAVPNADMVLRGMDGQMHRSSLLSLAVLTLSVSCLAQNASAEFAQGLVRSDNAAVHMEPSDTSPIEVYLPAGAGVTFESRPCDLQEPWCYVRARNWNPAVLAGEGGFFVTGWMRTTVMYPSNGVRLYGRGAVEAAVPVLAAEIRAANADSLVSSWLRFSLSDAEERLGAWSSAATTLEEILKLSQPNKFTPLAYLALAKLNLRHGNVRAALDVYGRMLSALPDDTVDFRACERSPVPDRNSLCFGDISIRKRIEATRTFLALKSAAEVTIADGHTSTLQKAAAWYSWEPRGRPRIK
jgi:hypothetical protein